MMETLQPQNSFFYFIKLLIGKSNATLLSLADGLYMYREASKNYPGQVDYVIVWEAKKWKRHNVQGWITHESDNIHICTFPNDERLKLFLKSYLQPSKGVETWFDAPRFIEFKIITLPPNTPSID